MQNKYTKLLDLIPTRNPEEFRVRLNTPFKPLFIGRLNMNGEGKFVTRKTEAAHFHRNSHSIALNAALLANPDFRFKWIEVEFIHKNGEREKLVSSRAYVQAKGKPFCYKNFEPQVSLELSQWSKERALRFDQEVDSQTELFDSKPVGKGGERHV